MGLEKRIRIYAGQYYDAETGLHYNYHRYYDPATGRYLTADPIGLAGGINLYNYVGGNPVNAIDPLGLYESSPWLMWVPGQQSWDNSLTAFENGQYGWGALHLGAMAGEQVMFALTLGHSGMAKSTGQCVLNNADDFAAGTSRLIGANKAKIDPRKLTEYALNPNHPVGGNKATVFDSVLGFNRSNADDLLMQLKRGVMEHTPKAGNVDKFGARFTVDIPVTGPGGNGIVRTGWIYKTGSNIPELTTLFVK